MWIGVLRIRLRNRFKGGRMSPYRGWKRWHHWFGLTGGVLLTTWIVSGWLSVDPGRVFDSPGIGDEARAAYAGAGRCRRSIGRVPQARRHSRTRGRCG